MNILALDTSMGACSAALITRDGDARRVFARAEKMPRGHAEALMPMIADIMGESGTAFAALDRIAAITGPGSFTGVRIAIAAARGLALVTGAKLYGNDSLTVMARQAHDLGVTRGAPFAVAVDARRGMLYLGLYDATARRRDGPLLVAPDDAANLLPAGLLAIVGSGAALLAGAASRRGLSVEPQLTDLEPNAAALATLAEESGETVPALRPLYLRPPDARPQTQAAVARC
ncbi:MAG: tRNA (adenosine(37)-N6)-threonylcarbamoyltransferase complex dimerization subunit type 1 TsaB [Methyloceanibacter sp.]